MWAKLCWALLFAGALAARAANVTVERVPNGGIQPQVAVDARGTVHLIYLSGEAAAADVYYVSRASAAKEFSAPIRVNTEAGSAIAAGTVRGAHISVGSSGRVHVAWMGSSRSATKGPGGGHAMFYSRLNDQRSAFEPQRNVAQFAGGLDGGASVAADEKGAVWVAWHGNPEKSGEENRAIWVASSADEGRTFAREKRLIEEQTGACACCGMRAMAAGGRLLVLYRGALEQVNRDMYLLASGPGGRDTRAQKLHAWKINACPMSTASLAHSNGSALAAWETEWQVHYAPIDLQTLEVSAPIAAPGAGKRKHPVLARNARGETLLAWTEGMAWKKGGSLAWQVFDRAGKPTAVKGTAPDVPVWGLAAVYAHADGGFSIIY